MNWEVWKVTSLLLQFPPSLVEFRAQVLKLSVPFVSFSPFIFFDFLYDPSKHKAKENGKNENKSNMNFFNCFFVTSVTNRSHVEQLWEALFPSMEPIFKLMRWFYLSDYRTDVILMPLGIKLSYIPYSSGLSFVPSVFCINAGIRRSWDKS